MQRTLRILTKSLLVLIGIGSVGMYAASFFMDTFHMHDQRDKVFSGFGTFFLGLYGITYVARFAPVYYLIWIANPLYWVSVLYLIPQLQIPPDDGDGPIPGVLISWWATLLGALAIPVGVTLLPGYYYWVASFFLLFTLYGALTVCQVAKQIRDASNRSTTYGDSLARARLFYASPILLMLVVLVASTWLPFPGGFYYQHRAVFPGWMMLVSGACVGAAACVALYLVFSGGGMNGPDNAGSHGSFLGKTFGMFAVVFAPLLILAARYAPWETWFGLKLFMMLPHSLHAVLFPFGASWFWILVSIVTMCLGLYFASRIKGESWGRTRFAIFLLLWFCAAWGIQAYKNGRHFGHFRLATQFKRNYAIDYTFDAITSLEEGYQSRLRETYGQVQVPFHAGLRHGKFYVRKDALDAIGRIGDSNALDLILPALLDDEEQVRVMAALASGRIRDAHAVDALLASTRDDSEDVRNAAITALGQIGDPKAVEPLIQAMQNDRDVEVSAANALGQLGDFRASKPLLEKLHSGSWSMSRAAGRALGLIGDPGMREPLLVALQNDDEDIRKGAAEALSLMRDPRAVDPVLKLVEDGKINAREAPDLLSRFGTPSVPKLIDALSRDSAMTRVAAATTLGRLDEPSAVMPLIQRLDDDNPDVRSAASEALGSLGDPRAVNPLIFMLKDKETTCRGAAANALGRIGDPRAIAPLASLMSGSSTVRDAALRSLRQLDPNNTLYAEADRLFQGTESERVVAAEALASSGDAAVDFLIAALKDSKQDVRVAAARSLGQSRNAKAASPLAQLLGGYDSDVRDAAMKSLIRIGEPSIPHLLDALLSDESSQRKIAAKTLAEIRPDDPVMSILPRLSAPIASERVDTVNQLAACGEQAVKPLLSCLKDSNPHVRATAAEAIGKAGSGAAISHLEELEKRETNEVVLKAVKAAIDKLSSGS